MRHSKSLNRRILDRLKFDVECIQTDLADPDVTTAQAIVRAVDVRGRLGWAINDLGLAILGLSSKLCPTCPSSFEQWFDDGYRMGVDTGRNDIVKLMVHGDTEISVVGRLIRDLGMDPGKVIAHLEQREVSR